MRRKLFAYDIQLLRLIQIRETSIPRSETPLTSLYLMERSSAKDQVQTLRSPYPLPEALQCSNPLGFLKQSSTGS